MSSSASDPFPRAAIDRAELEIEIAASPARVWEALTQETDAWWLADFRATGEDSTVRFDAHAGGHLIEERSDGSALIWYTVQMVVPQTSLYLVGHIAPDWGGPVLSMLKLSLEVRGQGCLLQVSDARMGRVDGSSDSTGQGWRQLFGEGLKRYVEQATARAGGDRD